MQTFKVEKYLILLSLVILLTGCKNALYFYETEKVSLTVEARPDSTQPVQGSLGFKQRVVLITPPKKCTSSKTGKTNGTPITTICTTSSDKNTSNPDTKRLNGDALSSISSFNFNIIDKPELWFNPVLIQTAFITGEAAAQLDITQAANAAQAISISNVQIPEANIAFMNNLVEKLNRVDHTEEDIKHLTLLNGLGKSVTPTNYPIPLFVLDRSKSELIETTHEGDSINYFDITSALNYSSDLLRSKQELKNVLDNPDKYKYEQITTNNRMVNSGLQITYEKTEQELNRLSQELANSDIYINAIQYYIDNYIKNIKGANNNETS